MLQRILLAVCLTGALAAADPGAWEAWSTKDHVAIDAVVDTGADEPAKQVRRYYAKDLVIVRIGERAWFSGTGLTTDRILIPADHVVAIAVIGNNQEFSSWLRSNPVPPLHAEPAK